MFSTHLIINYLNQNAILNAICGTICGCFVEQCRQYRSIHIYNVGEATISYRDLLPRLALLSSCSIFGINNATTARIINKRPINHNCGTMITLIPKYIPITNNIHFIRYKNLYFNLQFVRRAPP